MYNDIPVNMALRDSKKFNGNWNNLGEGYNLSYVFFVWTFQIFFFFLLELEKITSIQKYYQIRLIESYWSMFLEYKVERCAISKLARICWHIKIYQWNRFFSRRDRDMIIYLHCMLKGFSEYHPIDHVKIVRHAAIL